MSIVLRSSKYILSLVVVTLLLSACNRAPATGKVGEAIDYKGYVTTVNAVERGADFPGARRAKAGDILVAVEVIVESKHDKGVHFSPDHARLVDSTGKVYKAHTTGRQPLLQETFDISKGSKIQGWVTYEVPDNAKGLVWVNELPKDYNYTDVKFNLQ